MGETNAEHLSSSMKYKNKYLNLRKQIDVFNVINEDQKIKDFSDPINKNKYLAKVYIYNSLVEYII